MIRHVGVQGRVAVGVARHGCRVELRAGTARAPTPTSRVHSDRESREQKCGFKAALDDKTPAFSALETSARDRGQDIDAHRTIDTRASTTRLATFLYAYPYPPTRTALDQIYLRVVLLSSPCQSHAPVPVTQPRYKRRGRSRAFARATRSRVRANLRSHHLLHRSLLSIILRLHNRHGCRRRHAARCPLPAAPQAVLAASDGLVHLRSSVTQLHQ